MNRGEHVMSNYDNKPKRRSDIEYEKKKQHAFEHSYPDYSKKKNDDYSFSKERGGCLSAFLIIQFVLSTLLLCGACMLLLGYEPEVRYGYSSSQYSTAGLIVLVVVGIRLGLFYGVWKWSEFAYYGLLALYAFGILGTLLRGNFTTFILSVIEVGILYGLVTDKIDYFE
jgi:hypothetical protein